MWKAAFTGRSERSAKDETPSTTGRGERRRHRSGSDVQSVVSSASRRTEGDRRRKSEGRREPSVSYGAAPVMPTRGLTESAVNAFNAHRDQGNEEGEWEDEDGKSVARSRRGEEGERRKRREKGGRERSRSRERERDGKRGSRVSVSEKSRGKSKRGDFDDEEEGSRAIPAMGSFEQFPGMYDAAVVRPPEHTMSGGLPFDQHVQAQFPGQNPSTYSKPAFDLNPHGAAADYYGDMGESVKRQPGVRASTPMMLHNPDTHLVTPSAATQPAENTGQGAAADYYGGAATTIPLNASSSTSRPSKPTKHSSTSSTTKAAKKPGRTTSEGPATAAFAGAVASAHHSHRHSSASSSYYNNTTIPPVPAPTESNFTAPPPANTNNPHRPIRHNSEPVSVPGGGYYTAPSAVSGKPGKSSPPRSAHTGLYTAAGAAAAGAAAYGMKAHHDAHHTGRSEYDGPNPRGPNSQFGASHYGPQPYPPGAPSTYTPGAPSTYYGPAPPATPLGMEHRHEHRGPISRLKDGVLNLISSPDDIRRMEEYTEYIGVCKYCFDPRTSPSQGPRKHHYHPRRDSFESLRRRSMERLRRRGSGDSLRRAGSKVDKDSRYYPDRKGLSKTDLLAAGVGAAGVAGAAGAYFNDRKDFDDTYSVKSGHRAASAHRRRSRSSSREQRRRATHGVVGGERRDEYVTVRTKDGRLEKRRAHRSRSGSRDRKSGWMGAAAGAALAGGSVAAASSRHRRDSSPERVFVRHASHASYSRSRSRSHSPGLGEIFGFSNPPKSRRGRRASPNSSTYDISRPARPATSSGGGLLGGFFSPPEKGKKGKGHKKAKSAGFFTFSNGSSSSSNSELAFGDGFSGRSSVSRSNSGRKKKTTGRRNSDEKFNKTMLGIGATAAALAVAQKGGKVSKRPSRSDVSGRRDGRSRRYSSQSRDRNSNAVVEDDEWEDELPSDGGSDASSGLAFGSEAPRRRLSGQSMESLGSQSSAGGLGAWGWRWGGKKQRERRRTPSPQPSYPATPEPTMPGPVAASLAAGSAVDAYGRRVPSESSGSGLQNVPLQVVDPRPVSDYSSMPGGWDDDLEPAMGRPGPAPLQQPQPITPIPANFTSAPFDEALTATAGPSPRPSGPRRSVSSPVQPTGNNGNWMQDAALIGGAALATGSIIASQGPGRRSKEPGSVRFGFTEEQQRKVDKDIKRERDREDEERRRADRTRALKEEAERVGQEEDERRSRGERERRDAPKEETEEEAMLRESREREEAYRREQARFAEESRRRFEEQRQADAEAAKREAENAKREAEERLASERREQQERADMERSEREAAERKDDRKTKDKGKAKKSDRKRGESASSRSWASPVAAAGAGALAGAVLEGALHKDAREARDAPADSTSRSAKHRDSHSDSYEPYVAQTVEPTFSHSGAPITDDDLIDPDFFKHRPSAADRDAHEALARKAAEKVVAEREDYYHEPVQSQREFFMPKELLDRQAEGKERGGDGVRENDVQVYRAADDFYDKGVGKSGSEVSAKQGIPRLNLIEPTPPQSVAGSVKGDRSIPPSPLVEQERGAEDDVRSTASSRRPSSGRGISWGEDTTHVYQVRTPDSYKEGDGYMAQQEIPTSGQTPLDPEITVEVEDGEGAPEVTLDDVLSGAAAAGAGMGGYRQPFAASVSDFTTPQTPGTEGAPPVQGWVEGETNEPTPAEERSERMPGGFEDAVYAQTTREGRPESAFTHHDSREIDPNAKVPGEDAEWAGLSKKERKKREKAAKRGETLDSEPATSEAGREEPMAANREVAPEPEPAWEPPLSKKEQKKRDKAAKKGESEPSTPVAEPEPAIPAVEERAESAWEPPLSKKEQKKRDKAAKMAAAFDEPELATPAADERSMPEAEPAAPVVEEPIEAAWEPPLSKKEQKKRDKAAKLASAFDEPPPESEPTTPDQARSEPPQAFSTPDPEPEEAAWEAPLSKKELKKREKEAKKQGFADVAAELMTAGGVAAVVDAASKSEESEGSGKKSKKGKKKLGEPIDDDPRDIEPVANVEPSDMPGAWEGSPAPAAEESREMATDPQEAPAADEWGGADSKKSKKKKKRDSSRFNEPAASSPLRSEVAFDDYVGGEKAQEAPYSNGYSKDAEETGKNYFDDEKRVSESPRATSPDDAMRSVVSAPSDERRRSKSSRSRRESEYRDDEPYAFDDTRSVAASEPAGVYDAKSSKRRSRHQDDDTASVTSSRSKRDKDESPSAKKEKKGGFFGLFSRKSSDGVPLSRTSTKDSKEGKDREDDEERRERRHRRRQTGSEVGVDDDTRSNVSSSSRRHRRDHDERGEDSRERDRNRHRDSYDGSSRHGSGSRHRSRHSVDDPDRPRHHRRHRSDGLEDSADKSFLGKRVEGLPPLPTSRPASPGAAPVSEEQGSGTPALAAPAEVDRTVSGEDPSQQGFETTAPQNGDGKFSVGENQDLPRLETSASRPTSPTEYFHQRPVPPTRPLSSTAVPLRFRQPGSSPMAQKQRSTSFSSPAEAPSTASPTSPPKSKPSRHEFRNSAEIRPLFLVSRNAKIEDVEEQLPSLPSSKPSSRASSAHGSEDWHSAAEDAEDISDSPLRPKGLKIDTDDANRYVPSEDVLGSQQTTPKAVEMEDPLTARHYPKSEPQYYTWDDFQQDERLRGGPDGSQQGEGGIDFGRPPLSQISSEAADGGEQNGEGSPTRMSKKDKKKMKGLAAAAMLGGGAGALLASAGSDEKKDQEQSEDSAKAATKEGASTEQPPASEDQHLADTTEAAPDANTNIDDIWGDAEGDIIARPVVHRQVPLEDRLPEKPALSRKASKKKGKKGKVGSESQSDISTEPTTSASFVEPEADFDDWFGSGSAKGNVTEEPEKVETEKSEEVPAPAAEPEVPSALFERGGGKVAKKKGKKGKRQSTSEAPAEETPVAAPEDAESTEAGPAAQDNAGVTESDEQSGSRGLDNAEAAQPTDIQDPTATAKEQVVSEAQPANAIQNGDVSATTDDAPAEPPDAPAAPQEATEDAFAPTLTRKQSKKSKKKQKAQASFDDTPTEPQPESERGVEAPEQTAVESASRESPQSPEFQDALTSPTAAAEEAQPSSEAVAEPQDDWSATPSTKKGKKGKKAKKQAEDPWAETPSAGYDKQEAAPEGGEAFQDAPQESAAIETPVETLATAGDNVEPNVRDLAAGADATPAREVAEPEKTTEAATGRSWFPWSWGSKKAATEEKPSERTVEAAPLQAKADEEATAGAASEMPTEEQSPETSREVQEQPPATESQPQENGNAATAEQLPPAETPAGISFIHAPQPGDDSANQTADPSNNPKTFIEAIPEAPAEQQQAAEDDFWAAPVSKKKGKKGKKSAAKDESETQKTVEPESAEQPTGKDAAEPPFADQTAGTEAEASVESQPVAPEYQETAAQDSADPQPPADDSSFWTPELSKKKKKKGKKSAVETFDEPTPADATSEPPASVEDPQQVSQSEGGAPTAESAETETVQPADAANPEEPAPDVEADSFWTPPTSKKKAKKNKKAALESVEEAPADEDPFATEPSVYKQAEAPTTGTEEPAAEILSNDQSNAEQAPASDEKTEPPPAENEEEFWTAQPKGKKGKKGKRNKSAQAEEAPAPEESPAPETPAPEETPVAEEPREASTPPVETAEEQTLAPADAGQSDIPTDAQQAPPAATEDDLWALPAKGKKGKKGKKNKQASTEETPAPEETPAQDENAAPAASSEVPVPAVEAAEEQTPTPADAGQPETPADAQQAPPEAAEEDLWALPAKGKKGKKAKKGKRDSDIQEAPPTEPAQTPAEPSNADEAAQPADPVEASREDNTNTETEAAPIGQPEEAPNTEANDDWSSFGTGKKGKKAKKARKAALEAQSDQPEETTSAQHEGANQNDAPPSADNAQPTDAAAATDPIESMDSSGAREVPPADAAQDVVASDPAPDATVVEEQTHQPSGDGAGEALNEDADFFAPAKKSKKDKKKAKKAAAAASTDEGLASGDAEAQKPNEDGMEGQPTEPSESVPAENPNFEQTEPEATPDDNVVANPEIQVEEPIEAEFASISGKKSKKDKKKAKKAATWADDEPVAEQTEPSPETNTTPQTDNVEPSTTEPSTVEHSNAEPTTVELPTTESSTAKPSTEEHSAADPTDAATLAGPTESAEGPSALDNAVGGPEAAELEPVSTKKSKKDKKKAKKAGLWDFEEPQTENNESLLATDEGAFPAEATDDKAASPEAADRTISAEPQSGQPPAEAADENAAAAEPAGETSVHLDATDPPTTAEPQPDTVDVAGEQAAQGTTVGADEDFQTSSKKSKKDKKKAKKNKAVGFEDLGEQPETPATEDQAPPPVEDKPLEQAPEGAHHPTEPPAKQIDEGEQHLEATGSVEPERSETLPAANVTPEETSRAEPEPSAAEPSNLGGTVPTLPEPVLESTTDPATAEAAQAPKEEPEQEATDDFGSASTKKSKKDKKKAKKAKAADWDSPQPETDVTGGENAALDKTAEGEPETAPPAKDAPSAETPFNAQEAPANEEAPGSEATEDFGFSSKKSKKDKKKAKKSKAAEADLPEPESAVDEQVAEPAPTGDNVQEAGTEKDTTADDGIPAAETSTEPREPAAAMPEPRGVHEVLEEPITTNEDHTPNESQAQASTKEPDAVQPTASDQPTAQPDNTNGQDIDFAATLAAGLADSGFDPNLVVDDPNFHRRDSPPAQIAEADPDEAFPESAKKNKKKGKGKKNAAFDETPAEEPMQERKSNDFDATLSKGLQDSGFDAALLAGAGIAGAATAGAEPTEGNLKDEEEEASSTLPKKNKKKKGKKALQDAEVTETAAIPPVDYSASAPADAHTADKTLEESDRAPAPAGAAEPTQAEAGSTDEPDVGNEAEAPQPEQPAATEMPASNEAEADEWALPIKKKGKKGKKQRGLMSEDVETPPQPSSLDEASAEGTSAEPTAEPIEPTATQLESTKEMDMTIPTDAQADTAVGPQEAGEDEWAAPTKKKKGKKGKKRQDTEPEEQPATAAEPVVEAPQETAPEPAVAADTGVTQTDAPQENMPDNVKFAEDASVNVPEQTAHPEAFRKLATMSEDQPMPIEESQPTAPPPATEAGEDEWAPSAKKKGKKSKKKSAAADAELNPFAAPEAPAEPESTEGAPAQNAERGMEPGVVGGGEMDIDEMDKAYKAYKKNKRKAKKMKGVAGEGEGEQTPAEPQELRKPVEPAGEPSQSEDQARSAPPSSTGATTGDPEKPNGRERAAPPSSTGATTGDPAQTDERSNAAPPSSNGATTGIDSAEQATGPDGSPLSPSKIHGLFPGLQRVKRRAPSINKSTGDDKDVVVHTSEVSQNLPRGVEKSPSRPPKDNQETARSNDDVFAPESSERSGAGLGIAGAAAGAAATTWSFDGLNEQDQQPADREIPTIRTSTSRDSLQGRRSTPPLHIDTGSPEARARDASKKREGGELGASTGKHTRTPSYETPLESMSRNRASYLFQTPPDNAGANEGTANLQTPDRRSDNGEQSQSRSTDSIAKGANRSPLSPPPASPMSPRPLDTIPEEANAHKRHLAASNMATTDRAEKSQRRTGTPKAIRDNALSPVTSRQATATPSRSVSTPVNESNLRALPNRDENRPSKRVASDHRSPSAMSNRSALAHKTPEERRSFSALSTHSSTQSLRRVNMSGDLRAASRASNKRGNASETGSAGGATAKTIPPFEPPPTPPLNEDEFDAGASRATNMADFYQGYGDAQGSQVSPTRPPSVRKRQSMHIMELESKLEHLNSENAALQNARMGLSGQNVDGASLQQALEYRDLQLREKDNEIEQVRAMLEPMQQEISRLMELNGGLSEANRNLVDEGNGKYSALQGEHAHAQQQWQSTSRELETMREEHGKLTSGMRDAIAAQLTTAMAEKDHEIRKLKEDLEVASERIRALQVQIQSTKGNDFLSYRDEDYFDGACQKLCQHVQQWVVRFSKISDSRICRLSSDLKDDKLETRLDNALLDGTDVDKLLGDRVRRRDVFMSVVMTMVWEYVFTRYLFGMDREQRQKLKQLEKILSEVGPPRAVAQWRATTLTLLSKRPTFAKQCSLDTEAVAHEVFGLLRALLPPPSSHENQLLTSLQKVIGVAVDLSIEMRTQRAEYIMLPPLQPEYDTNGDLVRKVTFNASLMNERSGAYTSNEELEKERAVVKIVLFPLVVKKGDESGEGEEEIVVCPAQVLVHNDGGRARKVVRVMSGAMEIDEKRGSRMSLVSERPGSTQIF